MAQQLKEIIHKTGMETASELADRNNENIEILASNQTAIGDLPEEVAGKQDKLTSANAGDNITITEDDGIVKINAAVTIPTINGDNITATIDGSSQLIKDAITKNKQVSEKNTTDIAAVKATADANTTDIASNKTAIETANEVLAKVKTQQDLDAEDIKNLKANKAEKSDVDNKMNAFATGVNEFSDTDFSMSGKFVKVQDGYNANLHTDGKTFSSAINDTYDAVQKKQDKINQTTMEVTFKDGSTGSYGVINNG